MRKGTADLAYWAEQGIGDGHKEGSFLFQLEESQAAQKGKCKWPRGVQVQVHPASPVWEDAAAVSWPPPVLPYRTSFPMSETTGSPDPGPGVEEDCTC